MKARTLEVFEHGKLHVGDGDKQLRPAELDALVRFNDAHGNQFFDVGYKHLKAKQFVGYIEVGSVSIEILPKTDRDASGDAATWRDGLLEMLRVALGLRLQSLPSASQKLARNRLLDLIAQAFLAEVEPLLHVGLSKGYRTTRSNGAVFRGRLAISEHLRDNIARGDRFFVEYQTFDHDIMVNRILAAALDALSWCALSSSAATRVDACLAQFPEVQLSAITTSAFDRVRLGRSTLRYANALDYARMILANQGPHMRAGRDRVFALLFDMNLLWERYIATLLRRGAPPGLNITTQHHEPFWSCQGRARRVKPDILVRDEDLTTLLVIDTKWKVSASPSDEDLKQMFVYNELFACSRSILLYPRTSTSKAMRGIYAGKDHRCEQAHVGLFDDTNRWSSPAIRQQLSGLLSTCPATPGL